MHPYAIDTDEHRTVFVILGAASILAAWLLNKELTAAGITIPWWVDAPSVLAFFSIFYKAFDKWIWRMPPCRLISLVKIPNLNGTWKGDVTSSYDRRESQHGVTVKITQTWTQILVSLASETSTSRSLTASITVQNPDETVLTYHYINEPKASAQKSMHAHWGTAILTLQNRGKKLEGQYYSGRDRQNHGTISLSRR